MLRSVEFEKTDEERRKAEEFERVIGRTGSGLVGELLFEDPFIKQIENETLDLR